MACLPPDCDRSITSRSSSAGASAADDRRPAVEQFALQVEVDHLQVPGDRAGQQAHRLRIGEPVPQLVLRWQMLLVLFPGSEARPLLLEDRGQRAQAGGKIGACGFDQVVVSLDCSKGDFVFAIHRDTIRRRGSAPAAGRACSPRSASYCSPAVLRTVIVSVCAMPPPSAISTARSAVSGTGSGERLRHQATAFCRAKPSCSKQTNSALPMVRPTGSRRARSWVRLPPRRAWCGRE